MDNEFLPKVVTWDGIYREMQAQRGGEPLDSSWVEAQVEDLMHEEDEVMFVRKLKNFKRAMKGEYRNV